MAAARADSDMFEQLSTVMPALVAGIHALMRLREQGVDGRDKPGHDYGEMAQCLLKLL
jgi:hypothetical protein